MLFFSRETRAELLFFFFSRVSLVVFFFFQGGSRREPVASPVAGEMNRLNDVASPLLDVDDDDDVRARPLAPDAGAYHRIVSRRVSDVRQLQVKVEIESVEIE